MARRLVTNLIDLDEDDLTALVVSSTSAAMREVRGCATRKGVALRVYIEEHLNEIIENIAASIMSALKGRRDSVRSVPMPTTYIYALCEPDSDVIRYVGKSNDPEERWAQHIYFPPDKLLNPLSDTPKEEWIRGLLRDGKTPTLKVLEEVPRSEHWRAERRWIKWARDQGYDITNVANPS